MKFFFKTLSYAFVFLLFAVLLIAYLAIDSKPLISDVAAVDVESAALAKGTVKRLYKTLAASKKSQNEQVQIYSQAIPAQVKPSKITLSKHEIASLLSLAHKAVPKIKMQSGFVNNLATFHLSYQLPLKSLYLNLSVDLYASKKGLKVSDISLGSLSISQRLLIKSVIWWLDKKIEPGLGDALLQMVKTVDIDEEQISISYLLPSKLSASNDGTLAKLFKLRDQLSVFGKVENIQYYHDKLLQVRHERSSQKLADYLSVVLASAYIKSQESSDYSNVDENFYALMALVLYLGHDKFELLVGNVSSQMTRQQKATRNTLRNKLTLNGRVDLQKHFIYSVALQLFGNIDASDALGEFKELLDANGGSGFSFADLLADRVGTRFAQLATKNNASALHVQSYFLGKVNEQSFMPQHLDLPEGIDRESFKLNYANTQSTAYQLMIKAIDSRLHATELYQ